MVSCSCGTRDHIKHNYRKGENSVKCQEFVHKIEKLAWYFFVCFILFTNLF